MNEVSCAIAPFLRFEVLLDSFLDELRYGATLLNGRMLRVFHDCFFD